MGKVLIIIGIIIVIIGLIIHYIDDLSFLGRLPGDIRIKRQNFTFYFPIATSILFSILISLILFLINKFRH